MTAKRVDKANFFGYNAAYMSMFWKDIFAFGWLAAVRSVFALAVLGGGALAEENAFAKINWKTVTPAELDAAIADGKLDANAPFGDGDFPPLWHAVSKSDNLDLLDVLVRHGAEINQLSSEIEISALHLAAYQGRVPQMRRLLELGADVNLRDGAGEPVIFYPLKDSKNTVQQRKSAFDVLLEYDADLNAEPPLLGSSHASLGIVAQAAGHQCHHGMQTYEGILPYLLARGADVNYIRSDGGLSAMHIAAMFCSMEDGTMQKLVEWGGDVNADSSFSNFGAMPLMLFVQFGHDIAMFDYLVEQGANLDEKGDKGWSVLKNARARKRGGFDFFYDDEDFPFFGAKGFLDREKFRAFGDKIIARIESLCENREYEVCGELDEVPSTTGSVELGKGFFDKIGGKR